MTSKQIDIKNRCLFVLRKFINDEAILRKLIDGDSIILSITLDSLALINLMVELENEFFIQMDGNNIRQAFENLNNLVDYIEMKILKSEVK